VPPPSYNEFGNIPVAELAAAQGLAGLSRYLFEKDLDVSHQQIGKTSSENTVIHPNPAGRQ